MKILEFFSKYQKFIITSGVCLAAVAFFSGVLAIGIIFSVFLGAITLLFIGKNKEHAKVLGLLFIIVFTIHILASLFVYYTNFQPFSGGRGDFTEYNIIAKEVSNRVHSGNFSLEGIESLSHYYPVIVGYLYAVAVPDLLIGELFNAWLLAVLVIVIYFIVLETGASKKAAFIVGLVTNFYPSLVFFGSLLLKEALAGLLCALALLMMLKILKEFSWRKFLLFYIILLGVTHFRFYISYALALTFIICWLAFSNLKIKKRLLYGVLIIALLGFLPNLSGGQGEGHTYFGVNVIKQLLDPEAIVTYKETYIPRNESEIPEDIQGAVVSGEPGASNQSVIIEPIPRNDSAVVIKPGFENPITFFTNTSRAFVSVLLGPFPWQLKKIQHLFVLPEIIAWYILLFFIIRGVVKSIKKQYRVIVPLALFSFIVCGVLSIFLINYGITIRIRIPAILSLLCLLPLGFTGFKNINVSFLNNLNKYIS